ncbi:Nucleoside-diphosphate-sugar epimerase [Cetobacterium ceti]|uniref:Nucleoside-diphosphate-sugar epimerase n=1 Tax=Cetobacterium ceti TaxID=180163 RepID=A0A1T4LWZ8_9FUSO|nr:GDP-mannose 4,6-dehydratase [Cetobacterium ceti]SJZ58974.1 Nucleoside-diphosphate-sugar epimerase [Cetobacterium ceti]
MKTYLITGGAGFIGSTLSERILKDGNRVIAIDNFNDFYDYKIKVKNVLEVNNKKHNFEKESKELTIKKLQEIVNSENYKLEYADIRDLKELERIFEENKIDIVIHLAGLGGVRPSIEDPLLYEEVNVRGTNNIFEVMRRKGVKKILAASSSSVYGNNESVPFKETDIVDFAISPYAASKKANEVLAHTYHHLFNIDVGMLRFFTVFGPRQRPDLAIYKFTKLIDENKEIPFFGDGSTSRDYTYVDDIVKGVMLLSDYVEKNNNVYEISNIGGNDPVSLREMVETIEEVLGKEAKINYLPMQPGDVNRTYADLTKIQNLVGYSADNTFKEGIEKFVKWYLKEKN